MDGWCCQGAWALWRLCVSDFYQGKPIRPDRGMMILGHHHSGDTAPTNPATPSSIRQPKTPSHAPSFSFAPPDSPYPLSFSPLFTPSLLSCPPSHSLPFPVPLSRSRSITLEILPHPIVPYFHCFIYVYHVPSLRFSPPLSRSPSLSLSPPRALWWQTQRQILPFS